MSSVRLISVLFSRNEYIQIKASAAAIETTIGCYKIRFVQQGRQKETQIKTLRKHTRTVPFLPFKPLTKNHTSQKICYSLRRLKFSTGGVRVLLQIKRMM